MQYSLLLDGTAVPTIFGDAELEKLVLEVFSSAASVVVYRCSPGGKAQIVEFVMRDKRVHSLAIGDGGNDINMIQTAHIGIGIEGNEGSQAAYFSDYSIPSFKGLARLLLWHGQQFGKKSFVAYIPLNIFKGQLFMTPMFYQ